MDNAKKYSSFIKRIVTAPKLIRIKLLQSSNFDIIRAIAEIVLNILNKNLPVSSTVITRLKKHKKILYSLVESKKSLRQRREILIKYSDVIVPLAGLFSKRRIHILKCTF